MQEQPLLFKDLNPYQGQIDQNNRWIKLAKLIPWDTLSQIYMTYFHPGKHKVLKSCRLIVGLLIGQMILKLSDREIVEYFHENPYFQHFCGQDTFVVKLEKSIIHHSLLSKRRRTLGEDYIKQFEQEILEILKTKNLIKGNKLILDATVFPANITYPSDFKLLNTVREWCCKTIIKVKNTIDPNRKIRTYRKMGRKLYLKIQKTRKKFKAKMNKYQKQMLRFLNRNLNQLSDLLLEYQAQSNQLSCTISEATMIHIQACFETTKKIYDQQWHMASTRGRRIANRIVSFHQPYIRPIVRGKDGKVAEFGPKAHVALVDGFAFLDDCEYNAFHEGNRLPSSVQKHVDRFGKQPEVVIADQLYGTRQNRIFLQEHHIQHAFKSVGRPKKSISQDEHFVRKERKENQKIRNQIEGRFGYLKEHLHLNKVTWTVPDGALMQIRLGLATANLKHALANA